MSSTTNNAPLAHQGADSLSIIGETLEIVGSITTTSDLQIDGTVEGEVTAKILSVGQTASIKGDIVTEDVVISGRVIGSIRGEKVRLSNTAVVQGQIYHRVLAVEAGAHFEGSVEQSEDPLNRGSEPPAPAPDRTWETSDSTESDSTNIDDE